MLAQLEVKGVDAIIHGFETMINKVPEVRNKMLKTGAIITRKALKESAKTEMQVRSGRLVGSISMRKMGGSNPFYRIGPTGTHHSYVSKHSSGTTSAGHVGYIQEYGAPRRHIRGRAWVRKAVEKCTPDVYDAEGEIFDEFINSI